MPQADSAPRTTPVPPRLPATLRGGNQRAFNRSRRRCRTCSQGMLSTVPASSSATRFSISVAQAASTSRSGYPSRDSMSSPPSVARSSSESSAASFHTSVNVRLMVRFYSPDRALQLALSNVIRRRPGRPACSYGIQAQRSSRPSSSYRRAPIRSSAVQRFALSRSALTPSSSALGCKTLLCRTSRTMEGFGDGLRILGRDPQQRQRRTIGCAPSLLPVA